MKKERRIKLWKHNIGCVAACNENHGGSTDPKFWLVLLDTGTEPTISRCALSRKYLYLKKNKKKKYGTTLWPSWPRCKLSKSCCVLVSTWRRSWLTRLFTSRGHQSRTVGIAEIHAGKKELKGFTCFGPRRLRTFQTISDWKDYMHNQILVAQKKAFMPNWCLKLRRLRFIYY